MSTLIVLGQLILGWALTLLGVWHLSVNYSFWAVAFPIFAVYVILLFMAEREIDKWWNS